MKGLVLSILSMAAVGPAMVLAATHGSRFCLCQYGQGNAANDQTTKVCNQLPGSTLHYFDGPNDRDKLYCETPDNQHCFDSDNFYYYCNAYGAGGGKNCWGQCEPS